MPLRNPDRAYESRVRASERQQAARHADVYVCLECGRRKRHHTILGRPLPIFCSTDCVLEWQRRERADRQ